MNPAIENDGALIVAVSRSFALSLRVLPHPVRGTLSLGYLLARATDTLADAGDLPVHDRLHSLDAFADHIAGATSPGLTALRELTTRAAASTPHAGERQLLERAPELLARLDATPPADREDLRVVLAQIVRGQRLDLSRTADGRGVLQLTTAAELTEYADLVAGSVGEFWTRICLRKLPGCTRADPVELAALGRRFGRGLQWVNILRDFPSDASAGRCYLPADELRAAGSEPDAVRTNPGLARPVFEHWCRIAHDALDAGRAYANAMRSRRLRFAVALPCLLGTRTLHSVLAEFPAPGIKIPRSDLRGLALQTAIRCAFRHPI